MNPHEKMRIAIFFLLLSFILIAAVAEVFIHEDNNLNMSEEHNINEVMTAAPANYYDTHKAFDFNPKRVIY
ncbi:MAG: hypothetical protein WC002_01640 [Candidatus Muiribacteriota bacterium]